jgi:hypothetical protein
VGHGIPQGDGLAEGRRDLEVEVGVDVLVQVELALLDQLHHRGPGEQFGDRAGPKQRAVGIDQLLSFEVGVAIALLEEDLAVLDHHHHSAGDISSLKRVG